MRRRERLTGFFIIFILLTFSAYSNSMNVGGRMGAAENQQLEVGQKSYQQQDKNLAKKITNNNFNDKSIKSSAQKASSQINEQQNIASEEIKKNYNQDRENELIIKKQRVENEEKENNSQTEEKTAFAKRHEPELINQVKVHKVRSGETLWDIAHKHDLNIDSLIGANNISNMNSIKPGQEFKILPVKGIIYRVSPGESVGSIARKFNLKAETIMQDNNIKDASSLKIDQKLILRGAKPEFSYQDRLDQKFMYPVLVELFTVVGLLAMVML